MTAAEQKHALRVELRARTAALDPENRIRCGAAICAHVAALPDFDAAKTVLAFFGTAREIDTRPLLRETLRRGKTLCLPRCEAGNTLSLRVVHSFGELERGAFDMREPSAVCAVVAPEEIDFAVIPCLSFDAAGNRLGRGGGYYDRLLPSLTCPRVLVCREELTVEHVPTEPHDVPFTLLATEHGIFVPRSI